MTGLAGRYAGVSGPVSIVGVGILQEAHEACRSQRMPHLPAGGLQMLVAVVLGSA